MKKICFIMIFLILLSVLSAQEFDIDDIIKLGLENSYDINIQDYYLKNSKQNLYSSYLDLLPTANYSISRTENSANEVIQSGNIQISESISSNDSRYFSIRSNHMSHEKEKLDYESTRRNIIFEIISSYINLLEKKSNLELAKQNVKTAKLDFERTKVLKEHGKVSKLDLQQSKISLAQTQLDSLKAYDQYVNSKIELCYQVNINYSPNLDFKNIEYKFHDPVKNKYNPENNLSLLSAKEDLKLTKLNLFQNNLEFLPTLSFSVNKSFEWEKTTPLTFEDDQPYSFTLQLSYPLLNSIINYPHNRVYRNNLKVQKLLLQETSKEIEKDYIFYKTSYKQAKMGLKLAQRQTELTEMQYELIRQKYELGQSDITDLEKARQDLFNSKYDKVGKYYDLIILQENINLLTNVKLLQKY